MAACPNTQFRFHVPTFRILYTIIMERLCSDLFVACDDGDVEETKSLLKLGADPNHVSSRGGYVGNYPIHAAARSKSVGCVRVLVECGSRLDLRRKDGWTALHNAVMRRDYEIVHYLLEKQPTLVLLQVSLS